MRAVKRGDVWILNGQKTWTTYAPHADWLFVLARTDPEAKRHRGITCFIVPVDAPGVEVRTIIDSAGTDEFGEVFFSDAEIPESCVLGGVNEGWSVAIMTLAFERVIESCEDIGELEFAFDRLLDCLRDLASRARGGSSTPAYAMSSRGCGAALPPSSSSNTARCARSKRVRRRPRRARSSSSPGRRSPSRWRNSASSCSPPTRSVTASGRGTVVGDGLSRVPINDHLRGHERNPAQRDRRAHPRASAFPLAR